MRTDMDIGIFDGIMFLGIIQGLFLAILFLNHSGKEKTANLYQGLFLLALTLAILEEFLNNTGYIVRMLSLSNFAEPLNLAYGPLLYLYVKRSLKPGIKNKKDGFHFILFLIYLAYMFFFFLQPEAVKYNAWLHSKHPGWTMLEVTPAFAEDPLGVRALINPITAIHFGTYLVLTFLTVRQATAKGDKTNKQMIQLKELKQSTFHFMMIILIFTGTKLYFGRDLGDYFITSYITVMFVLTAFRIMKASDYFSRTHSFMEIPLSKYQKSSLTDQRKQNILKDIREEMEKNRYYTNHLASLAGLASRLNESTHHVSQVINEKIHCNFFEMIASYRIGHAMELLRDEHNQKLTVEEIAGQVGYNSKSAFNKAFKKITGQTPSEYRKTYTS